MDSQLASSEIFLKTNDSHKKLHPSLTSATLQQWGPFCVARWLKSVTPYISHTSVTFVTFTVYVPDAFIELVNIIKSCSIVEGSTRENREIYIFWECPFKKIFCGFQN